MASAGFSKCCADPSMNFPRRDATKVLILEDIQTLFYKKRGAKPCILGMFQ